MFFISRKGRDYARRLYSSLGIVGNTLSSAFKRPQDLKKGRGIYFYFYFCRRACTKDTIILIKLSAHQAGPRRS